MTESTLHHVARQDQSRSRRTAYWRWQSRQGKCNLTRLDGRVRQHHDFAASVDTLLNQVGKGWHVMRLEIAGRVGFDANDVDRLSGSVAAHGDAVLVVRRQFRTHLPAGPSCKRIRKSIPATTLVLD